MENELGLSICYDEIESDMGLTQRIIETEESNKTPIPSPIEISVLAYEAKVNLKRKYGKSYGMILMLLCNSDTPNT